MKLRNYADALIILAKKYPDADVVHATDDDGNGFNKVVFEPTAGNFNMGQFNCDVTPKKVNAVCVN